MDPMRYNEALGREENGGVTGLPIEDSVVLRAAVRELVRELERRAETVGFDLELARRLDAVKEALG